MRNHVIPWIVLLAGQLLCIPAWAQLDRPGIKNFTKDMYKAENQNWGIGQDELGTLYFANNQGLLTYDGVSWNVYPLPQNAMARSIEVVSSKKIFTGSYEEFGFWDKDVQGTLRYTSLKPLLGEYNFHNEEIWKIISRNGITYFQSFSVIFAYDGKKIDILSPPGLVNCFTLVNGKLFLVIADHGLYELDGTIIRLVDDSGFFRQKLIRVILPYGNDQMLVATSNDGMFIRSASGELTGWGMGQESFDRNSSINRGTVTQDGLYIIGTILEGIYAFDRNGRTVFHVNKENGLQNNTVLGIFVDSDENLWAGLDNGIDLINTQSNVSFYYDLAGKIGSVYTVIFRDGILYAGTNQGLFYSKFNPAGGTTKLKFELIENSPGQVWSLNNFDNQLFCGHNDRTYEIKGQDISVISPVSGGFSFCRLNNLSGDHLLQSTYTDLVLYTKKNGKWAFDHTIDDFRNPIRYIAVDPLGNIWASHLQRGVYRLTLNDDLKKISKASFYGRNKGFASDFNINAFKVQNRVVFTNEGHVYTYNDLYDSIVKFDFIEEQVPVNTKIQSIIPAGNQDYWFVTENSFDLYAFTTGKITIKQRYPFELFDNKLIRHYENIYPLDSASWMVCLENGVAIVKLGAEKNVIHNKQAFINKIVTTGRHPLIVSPIDTGRINSLSYSQNGLVFYFSCPVFDSRLHFLVKLDGIDNTWIQTELPLYKYDRLPWGNYTFHVKAMDALGNESALASWPFVIKAPWYWSIGSRLMYASMIVLFFIYLRASFSRRLKKQEQRLSAEKERELVELNNEKLQSEVHYKSMQLANTTFSIIKKNELLLEIKKLLSANKQISDPKILGQFRDIRKLLDQKISNDDDWKIFESNFEQAHEAFLKRIKKEFPNLTPSDLKLCAFIRMNLSSKKIAPLLGISIRGVENHRYRLRTKMGLDRDVNLTEYLMEF